MPSDAQRIASIKSLVDEGFEDRVVIGHDIHNKSGWSVSISYYHNNKIAALGDACVPNRYCRQPRKCGLITVDTAVPVNFVDAEAVTGIHYDTVASGDPG